MDDHRDGSNYHSCHIMEENMKSFERLNGLGGLGYCTASVFARDCDPVLLLWEGFMTGRFGEFLGFSRKTQAIWEVFPFPWGGFLGVPPKKNSVSRWRIEKPRGRREKPPILFEFLTPPPTREPWFVCVRLGLTRFFPRFFSGRRSRPRKISAHSQKPLIFRTWAKSVFCTYLNNYFPWWKKLYSYLGHLDFLSRIPFQPSGKALALKSYPRKKKKASAVRNYYFCAHHSKCKKLLKMYVRANEVFGQFFHFQLHGSPQP